MSTKSERYLLVIRGLRIEGQSDETWSQIVTDVNISVARGRVLGLIGESGAGKSTIGIAAMGYVRSGCRFTGGQIFFDGIDLRTLSETDLDNLRGNRISYVAQSAAATFNPAHRLIDQIVEVALIHGGMSRHIAQNRAVELFAKLKLPQPESIGQRYPHQVSGGQLQRAMTAMALVFKPDLVVFDEPTTALDVTTQIDVLAAIKATIEDEGAAAIYISHDLPVVAQIAHDVVVLRHGEVIETGRTTQIIQNPHEPYTKALVNLRRFEQSTFSGQSDVPLLSINSVVAAYGDKKTVLNNISLHVEKGQTLAVVGESGSGKSTMARVITGLLPLLSGTVLFDGELMPTTLSARSKEQKRAIQMIYQSPDVSLNPRQTVREILGRPLTFYFGITGADLERQMLALLDQIEISKRFANRYPAELSGGQKQRICIARALAARPRLILCDEPTSALDPLVADGILKLLLNLQRETGVAYVFITHDIATVRAIADSVCVIFKGRVVRFGPKETALSPPFDDYTDLLLSSVPEPQSGWLEQAIEKRRIESAGN